MSLGNDYQGQRHDADDEVAMGVVAAVTVDATTQSGFARVSGAVELHNLIQNLLGEETYITLKNAEKHFPNSSLIVAVTPAFADNHAHEQHYEFNGGTVDTELCLMRKEGAASTPATSSMFIFAVSPGVEKTTFWVVGPNQQDISTYPADAALKPFPDSFLMAPRKRPKTPEGKVAEAKAVVEVGSALN